MRGNSQARFGEGRQEKVRKEPRLPSTLQYPDEVPCPAEGHTGAIPLRCADVFTATDMCLNGFNTFKKADDDMRNLKRYIGLFLVLLLALTVLLAACGGNTSSATPSLVKGEFAEYLNLGDFGLSTDGQRVMAYLCDGTSVHLSLAEWFKGAVTNNTIDITNAHGSHLVATLTPQAVTGTITLRDGRSSPFNAQIIPNPGNEFGLYRSEQPINGVQYLGGWIHNPLSQANAPVEGEAFAASALNPLITCCNPMDRGGIINEQTGALIISPEPDFPNPQVTVQNLGTFRLTLCRQGAC